MPTRRSMVAALASLLVGPSVVKAADPVVIYHNGSGESIAQFQMQGESMFPTLQNKDTVLIDLSAYVKRTPQQGDVIIFTPPTSNSNPFVKRVIAVGGQVVEIIDRRVWIDGKVLAEPYVKESGTDCQTICSWTIAKDYLFVLGDHRSNSSDSRVFGPIKIGTVIGHVFYVESQPGGHPVA